MLTLASNNAGKVREIREILLLPVQTLSEAGITSDPEEDGKTFAENALIKAKAAYDKLIVAKTDGKSAETDGKSAEINGISAKTDGKPSKTDGTPDALSAANFVVIADDTGLCIDALDGQPGVYSARFASPDKLCTKVLDLMAEEQNRAAHFSTVICYYDGEPHYFEGRVDGFITYESRGNGGFGYDPIFEVNGKTFAEMSETEKNAISHRYRALLKLKKYMENNGC
jgi:XTP/dITP diphosphohydrolase